VKKVNPQKIGGKKALCDAGFPQDTPFSKNITHGGKGVKKRHSFSRENKHDAENAGFGETPCESREIIPPNFSEVADNTTTEAMDRPATRWTK
jgi:hypothetical protein